MPRRDHRTRTVLFLAAVLLPSAVLVGTTLQVIRQERELSVRRWEEERALLALRLGQELLIDLSELDEQLSGLPLSSPDIYRFNDSHPALLAVAWKQGEQLVFPWEIRSDPASGVDAARLARYHRFLRDGEEAEYREGRFEEAADSYRAAADVFGDGFEDFAATNESLPRMTLRAEALVHRARALSRAELGGEAQKVFREFLILPPTLTDREGMPFSIYALDGLHRLGDDPASLFSHLVETLEARQNLSSPALFAIRELTEELASSAGAASDRDLFLKAGDSIVHRVRTVQALEDLRGSFPALLATAQANGGTREGGPRSVWIPYGPEPWLVGFRGGVEAEGITLTVVRPSTLLEDAEGYEGGLAQVAQAVRPLSVGAGGGETLGGALNGLRVSFPPTVPPLPGGGTVEGWFYRLLLPVILILTGFTAYLAWRDVRRETEAVRLRSQFVSSVTHELKTPLTSIRMFTETLRLGRHSGPEAQQEYLDTVVHETERLSRLINNVLDFARIERGEKTYHMVSTDVGAAVQEAARAVAYPLAQGGYTLTTEIAEDLPWVDADPDSLTQAVLNLLSNAIKYSDEGSEIGLKVFKERGNLHIQVKDPGRGIAPQDQAAIFEDFYRTADAEEDGIPGTGLGLSLVAHVAEAHGGQVVVESEEGLGSTFTILIPTGDGSPQEEGTP